MRLRPITYSQQKQLIPVANKPILFYCIEDLIGAGIDTIGIVVGPNKEQVIAAVTGQDWDARFEFISQDAPRGLAHAVKISENFIGNDDFIMYLGDNLLKGGISGFVDDFISSDVESSLLLTHVDNPERYGVALVDEQKKVIVQLIEKPKNPPSNLSIVGIYGLTPTVFRAIDHIRPSWRGELEITDALHWLIEEGHSVRYGMVEGWWKDTGKPEDILEANRLVLESMAARDAPRRGSTRIPGSVWVGKETEISPNSVIMGPAVIGDGCTVTDAYIGPFSSIGDHCEIVNTEIENTIVMDGTKIRDVERIFGSLIGKDVIIEKKDRLPRGTNFFIGDCSHVMM